MQFPLSVAIISYNEERHLERCLQSISEFAQEIVIVDSGSTDRTLEIAKNFGALIKHQPWLGYRDQKNSALTLCSQPWVLSLDCDEELSPELQESVRLFFKKGESNKASVEGARFHRRTWFLGRWIRHGDWYPDTQLRLFRREKGIWREPIHERIVLEGGVVTLQGDLLHYSFPSMNAYITKINPFADEFLKKQVGRGASWSLGVTVARPLWRFFRAYILKRGFLDGFPGLWIAIATAFSTFVRYSRLYEEARKESNG